jgi:hypothetical protein
VVWVEQETRQFHKAKWYAPQGMHSHGPLDRDSFSIDVEVVLPGYATND